MFVPLQTARRRIERAKFHAHTLVEFWNSRKANETYTHRVEMEDDGTGKLFVSPVDPGWLSEFPLHFGEMLYQLRATLDSCIYDAAIVETGLHTPPNEGKLQFPICPTPNDFKGRSQQIAPLSNKVKAFIESVQPYHTAPPKEAEIARILEAINHYSRMDRHRTLSVVGTFPTEISGSLIVPLGMSVENFDVTDIRLLEHENHLATFKVRGFGKGAHVDVNLKFAIEIAVERANGLELITNAPAGMIAVAEEIARQFQSLL